MIGMDVLLSIVALLQVISLHGGTVPTPVPHWAVLLAVVPSLWCVIGAGVLAIDRLLQRFKADEYPAPQY